jgi:hypothetical protein
MTILYRTWGRILLFYIILEDYSCSFDMLLIMPLFYLILSLWSALNFNSIIVTRGENVPFYERHDL